MVKFLSELEQHELAIDLALAYNLGVGYSVAAFMDHIKKQGGSDEADKRLQRHNEQVGERALRVLAEKFSLGQMLEVAEAMWS